MYFILWEIHVQNSDHTYILQMQWNMHAHMSDKPFAILFWQAAGWVLEMRMCVKHWACLEAAVEEALERTHGTRNWMRNGLSLDRDSFLAQ